MNEIDTVAELIIRQRHIVVFTGAGMSTESGLADFRSPGGIWEQYDAVDFSYQKFLACPASRERYWQFSLLFWRQLAEARPNAGHRAVAELHHLGKLDCVITQNIDNLHQASGIPTARVIELHGSAHQVSCLGCGKPFTAETVHQRIAAGERDPHCPRCGGILKPEVVFFGQPMPGQALAFAQKKSNQARLFLVAGSSLVVTPAATLPLLAKKQGAFLVIINREPTFQDAYADVVIHDSIGAVLPRIMDMMKQKLK